MNKKYLKIIIIVLVALVLSILFVFYKTNLFNNSKTVHKVEIMNTDEKADLSLYRLGIYEVVSRDASGKVKEYKMTGLEDEKPIDAEFMTDDEKVANNLATSTKIQVLQRSSTGKILAYKIIRKDNDVISKY